MFTKLNIVSTSKKEKGERVLKPHRFIVKESVPQRNDMPLGHRVDVQQVLDPDVFGHRVAAPGAAAQGQGGSQLEVVQVADTAL